MSTNPPFYMRAGRRTIAGIVVAVILGGVLWWNFGIRQANDNRQDDEFVVAVTIPPLASIAEQIIQDEGEVVALLPAGTSPHTFEPQPQDLLDAQRSDVFVVVGEGFDDWALPFVPEKTPRLDTASTSGVERVAFEHEDEHGHEDEDEHGHSDEEAHGHEDEDAHEEDEHGHDEDDDHGHKDDEDEHGHSGEEAHDEDEHGHEDEDDDHGHADEDVHAHEDDVHAHDEEDDHGIEEVHDHAHGEFDPHIWLSATNGALIAERYGEVFAEYDPENAELYLARASDLAADLRILAQELGENDKKESVAFVSMHDAWRTFADAQNMLVVGSVEEIPGKVPTPRELLALTEAAEDGTAQFVATEPQLSEQVATTLACDLGLPTIVLDPLGGSTLEGRETYQDLLRYNVAAVEEALRKGSASDFDACAQ